jgi:hypothetical protein
MSTLSTDLDGFRVVPFSKEEYTPVDKSGAPLFTWREFYGFRNELLRVLQPYGTVGPMGEIPILEDWESSEKAWKGGTSNPDFFVVSDMYNEYNRWNRVEADPWFVTTPLLHDLVAMVRRWPGWCVYLALVKGGVTILEDRILYEGELFAGATSVEELGARCYTAKP